MSLDCWAVNLKIWNCDMTSKERVHAALRRQPVDRIPVFMWFHPDTAQLLARELEIPAAAVAQVMGNDIAQTWVNNNFAMEGIVHACDGDTHIDAWGIRWVKAGAFNQIAHHPLLGAPHAEVLAYRFPEAQQEDLLALMAPVNALAEQLFIGCDVSPCVFEMSWRLRGLEDTLTDMGLEPDRAKSLFRRCADFAVRLGEAACQRYRLDWLWSGDDVASQTGLMMSPVMWRALVKPELKRVFDVGRAHGIWNAYHCCGALRPIIPDLIEIGMDVLNPVQCNCPGMEPLRLKQEYGRRLAFMGGIDTQGVLPHGSVDDVRRATRRLIDGMTADGGGYILAASHTIPPETPLANIFAMYAEAGITREEILDRAARLRAARA